MFVCILGLASSTFSKISKVQLQASYAVKATQRKQELLQYSKWVLLATNQAEAAIAGLQDAVRQMCESNTDVSQSFRFGSSFIPSAIMMRFPTVAGDLHCIDFQMKEVLSSSLGTDNYMVALAHCLCVASTLPYTFHDSPRTLRESGLLLITCVMIRFLSCPYCDRTLTLYLICVRSGCMWMGICTVSCTQYHFTTKLSTCDQPLVGMSYTVLPWSHV